MWENIGLVVLVTVVGAAVATSIAIYLYLLKRAGLWDRETPNKIPCPVPFPTCGPDDCPNCGGKGYTIRET